MMDVEYKRQLEKRMREVEQRTRHLPARMTPGGGGQINETIWYEAESFPELIDASTVAKTAMARVTAGIQEGQIYKVDANEVAWKSVHETYEGATGATLPENEYIQQHALARVNSEDDENGDIYARDATNSGWVKIAPFPDAVMMYTATTKAGLPSGVDAISLGRVTAGTDSGVLYKRNAANSGWEAITKWE